jgi:hypothetical protein
MEFLLLKKDLQLLVKEELFKVLNEKLPYGDTNSSR